MTNLNDRSKDRNNSNEKAGEQKPKGGNMGAGKSGKESLGSEKPSDRDNMGSKRPGSGNRAEE